MKKNEIKPVDWIGMIDWTEFATFPHGVDVSDIGEEETEMIIDLCGQWIEEFCDKPFLTQEWEDRRFGNGSERFGLFHDAQSIVSVDQIIDASTTINVPLSQIRLDRPSKYIEYESGYFSAMYTYSVRYMTGIPVIPKKVKQALFLTMGDFVNRRDYQGMKSIKLDTITVNFDKQADPLPLMAKILLKQWKDSSNVF